MTPSTSATWSTTSTTPIDFYTKQLGFERAHERRARVRRRQARATCGCCSAARRAPPAGRCPTAAARSRAAGTASTSSSTTSTPRSPGSAPPARRSATTSSTGPGGKQILLEDPSGNLVELFQPPRDAGHLTRWRRRSPRRRCATVLGQWGRIGCIGFGGPPAHIALLRELCVDDRKWIDAARVRGRDRGVQPAARPGVDAARDLLRLAGRAARRRARRRRRVHRARAGRSSSALAALFLAARRRPGCSAPAPAPAPRSPRSRCTPAPTWSRPAGAARRGAARRWVALRAAGGATAAATVGPWLVARAARLRPRRDSRSRTFGRAGTARHAPAGRCCRGRDRRPAACSRWRGSRSRSARSPTAAAS